MTDGGPAFPAVIHVSSSTVDIKKTKGMTLRDWFAGKAISIFDVGQEEIQRIQKGDPPDHKTVAKFCYKLADIMLKERGKNGIE